MIVRRDSADDLEVPVTTRYLLAVMADRSETAIALGELRLKQADHESRIADLELTDKAAQQSELTTLRMQARAMQEARAKALEGRVASTGEAVAGEEKKKLSSLEADEKEHRRERRARTWAIVMFLLGLIGGGLFQLLLRKL